MLDKIYEWVIRILFLLLLIIAVLLAIGVIYYLLENYKTLFTVNLMDMWAI